MEPINDLLYGAGQVVLQIAQAHVYPIAALFHLNEIGEAEHHVLVTVTDQNIEVRIDDRGLVPPCHLERRRPDAVGLVGLSLFLGILGRIYDLQLHLATGGDLVLAQRVTDTWDQGGKQRVCLLAEVASDQ